MCNKSKDAGSSDSDSSSGGCNCSRVACSRGNERGEKKTNSSSSSCSSQESTLKRRRHSDSESTFIIDPFRSTRDLIAEGYRSVYGRQAPAALRPTPTEQDMAAGGEGGAQGDARAASESSESQGEGQDTNHDSDYFSSPSPTSSIGSDIVFFSSEDSYESDVTNPLCFNGRSYTGGRGSVSTLSHGWNEGSWTKIYDWANCSV